MKLVYNLTSNVLNRKRRNRHLTKQLIVKAVGEAIAQVGVEKAGINAIADVSGYNKVLIYRYFGGRNGLYVAYLSEVLEQLEKEVVSIAAPVEEVTYYVYTYLSKFAELISTTPALQKIIVWQIQNPEHSTSLQIDEVLKGVENRLTDKLSKSEAALVRMIVPGIIFQLIKKPDSFHPIKNQLKQVFGKLSRLPLKPVSEEV